MNLKHIVGIDDADKKVKHILKYRLGISERFIKKLKYDRRIFINSIPVFVNAVVKPGDMVEANIDFIEENSDLIPEPIPIDIVYEDEGMIIINKAPGIVVHPTSSHPSGTVANAIMHHLKEKGIIKKVRPVSRLDRDTSGIIIFAKNEFVQESLIRQMNGNTFSKEYLGIAQGIVKEAEGTIDMPIARLPGSIMSRHVSEEGDRAVTHFKVIEYLNNATYLLFKLETGRTHQIRVHCQAINHPLIGDTLYSCIKTDIIGRQALHSHRVTFSHPLSGRLMEFTAPAPEDILAALEILRK